MKQFTSLLVLLLVFTGAASGQISVTGPLPFNYSQNFNSYAGNATSFPVGWSASGTFTYRGVGTGTNNSGGAWAFGTGTDRSLGALGSGTSNNINYRATFVNNSATTITGIVITYKFEQWRWGGGNTNGFVVTQSGIGAAVTGLNQASAASGGTDGNVQTTSKSITLSGLNILPNATFYINWQVLDGSGSDNAVAIDDFTLTATGVAAVAPVVSTDPINDSACTAQAASYTAAATNATGYQWQVHDGSSWSNVPNGGVYSGATTTTLNISNTTGLNNRQYRMIATAGNAADTSAAALLVVHPLPATTISPAGNASFCAGDSLQFHLSNSPGSWTYQWLHGSNPITAATDSTLTISANGNYRVVTTSVQGCRDTAVAVNANIDLLNANISPAGSPIFCTGDSVLLQANAGSGYSYQWLLNGGLLPASTSADIYGLASGNYQAVVTNATGCIDTSAMQTVVANSAPPAVISYSSPLTFCQDAVTLLDAGNMQGLTYQWKRNGSNIANATTATHPAAISGAYTVTVSTGSSNCSNTSLPVNITVHPLPTVTATITGLAAVCDGQTVALAANTGTGYSYQWLHDDVLLANANTASYQATLTGGYAVKITDANNCTDTSQEVQVTIYNRPVATIAGASPLTFCAGSTTSLQANNSNGWQYQWMHGNAIISGQTTGNITTGASGNYAVQITDTNGCRDTSNILAVLANPLPQVTLNAGGATTFCSGLNVSLNANAGTGLSYRWKTGTANIAGATAQSYTATTSGSYSVVLKETATGCSDSSAALGVTVHPLPTATATAFGNTTVCGGDSVKLAANTGTLLQYQWLYNTLPVAGYSASHTAFVSGNYAVRITDSNNCVRTSAPVAVIVNPLASAQITYSSPVAFCQGSGVVLNVTANMASGYQWLRNGSLVANATADHYLVSEGGNYTVQMLNSFNCTSRTAAVAVTVYPKPQPLITHNGLTFSTGSFATYQWYRNNLGIGGATGPQLTVTQNGAYHVEVTGVNGCTNRSASSMIMNVGVPEYSTVNYRLYPNPARDLIYTESTDVAAMLLVDLNGKVLQKTEGRQIRLPALSGGMYIVQLLGKSGILLSVEKLMVVE